MQCDGPCTVCGKEGTSSGLCAICKMGTPQRRLERAIDRATAAEAERDRLADLDVRVCDVVNEECGLQPVMSADEMLTALERHLFEQRQLRDRLREALEQLIERVELHYKFGGCAGSNGLDKGIADGRAALRPDGKAGDNG